MCVEKPPEYDDDVSKNADAAAPLRQLMVAPEDTEAQSSRLNGLIVGKSSRLFCLASLLGGVGSSLCLFTASVMLIKLCMHAGAKASLQSNSSLVTDGQDGTTTLCCQGAASPSHGCLSPSSIRTCRRS